MYVIITIPLSWGYEPLCIVNNKYTFILKEKKIEDFIIQACVHMFENCKKKNSDNHFFLVKVNPYFVYYWSKRDRKRKKKCKEDLSLWGGEKSK